jgi:hypothetical protein
LAGVGTDLISRQQAIDAYGDWYVEEGMEHGFIGTVKQLLEGLPSAQPEPCEDAVSREKVKELAYSQIRSEYSGIALKEQREAMLRIADNVIGLLAPVASKQPEIVRCKDCKYWHSGSCEYPEHVVNSQDYYVGDIETEAEHFCGYAERREVAT